MNTCHYILATAGHIDHGKSALVQALSGSDPDRLPEEKKRGITIDLGFAHLDLKSPDGQTQFSVGIIDVPGHEDFVKNMVAGMGSVDCALLVVAADDGWMPQTEEHFQILNYLGVTHGVVALTKSDLPEADVELATEDIRDRLVDTPLGKIPIVPVSSVTGDGIEALKNELTTALTETPPPRDLGKPRLSVDRVFTLKGIGTVVTGTLNGGVLTKGQHAVLQPGARKTRVRSLQSHNHEIDTALPGARTAVNLTDTSRESVTRGATLTLPNLGESAKTVDVWLERSENSPRRVMKNNALFRVHHGSGNEPARLVLLDGKEVAVGDRVLAQFRFEHSVYMLAGDRLVVRDWSETATLAGGLVIDPQSRRRGFRAETQRGLLETCASSLQPAVWMSAFLKRDGAVKRDELLRQSRFGERDVADALESDNSVIAVGNWVADAERWQQAHDEVVAIIDTEHKAHPERPGVMLDVLRARVQKLLPEGVVVALLEELCADEFQRKGTVMSRTSHTLELPETMQAGVDKLRTALLAKPMEPPARKDLTDTKALRFMIDAGEAVEISSELVMDTAAFKNAVDQIRQRLQQGGAKASELREVLGTNRRVIIPLLEKLDRDRVTVRQGDLRILRG